MDEARLGEGRIVRGIGGFYYVEDENGGVHRCRARGVFRKEGTTPLVGDVCLYSDGGFIEKIKSRKNELRRPRVANVDIVAIVVSAEKPKIDYILCDKLLVDIKRARIRPILIINKCDVAEERSIASISGEYKNACDVVCVSARTGFGIEALKEALSGSCTCFAGQSAAGKSSILNALSPELRLETGELSRKTGRGTHTTREARLIKIGGFPGTLVDTPGFSALEVSPLPPEELILYYGDMLPYASGCRFSGCLHAGEPGCSVKKAVDKNLISAPRYERYLEILDEIKKLRSLRYD